MSTNKKEKGGGAEPNVLPYTIFTGDNLPILRGIDSFCIDLIYLDPPFNSNHNYAAPIGSEAAGAKFKDTWTLNEIDRAWMEEIGKRHRGVKMVIEASEEASGKSMMSYLIYMAIRLIEMHRILKDTGSIYLHCDPTASHYLKLILDAVFGQAWFRNEISWRRYGSHNDGKRYGRVSDRLLYYGKSKSVTWNPQYKELDAEYVESTYCYEDEKGKYMSGPMTGPSSGYEYEWNGVTKQWRYPLNTMRELDKAGKILYPKKVNGVPRVKRYLSDSKGVPLADVWDDVRALTGNNKERTGYPTQKPLALLERIIQVSSNPGDLVLDPFCGCATTLVAAQERREEHHRAWIGIDISLKAVDLIKTRFSKELGIFNPNIIERTDLPARTGAKPSRGIKNILYSLQSGNCNLCAIHMSDKKHFHLDHITPKQAGGPNVDENLQLLCGNCNSSKGVKSMTTITAEYREKGRQTNQNPRYIADLTKAERKDYSLPQKPVFY